MLTETTNRLNLLPTEKREKILNACLDEFAVHGYQNASTNRIVKAAGVSKGLLFHYFDSKKTLFITILDYTITELMALMDKHKSDLIPGDIFEMLGQYAAMKIKVALEAPKLYHILYDVYTRFPEDIKNDLMSRYGQILSDQRKLFINMMDTSLLREDVDKQTVINLIIDFLDGYYKRRIDDLKAMSAEQLLETIDDLNRDVMKHLDIIRRGVYKQL